MTNVAHMEKKKREREKINQELGKYFFTTLLVKDPSSLSTNTVKDLPCLDLTLIITQFKLLAINTLALTEDTVPKKKSPFEIVILRMCAASPHSLSSCRLGNGKGGGSRPEGRRGTRTPLYMSVPVIVISVVDRYYGFSNSERL